MNNMFFNAVDVAAPSQARCTFDEPIAIVSTACRMAGDISSLADLNTALLSQKQILQPLPSCLYKRDYRDSSRVNGGLIEDLFDFDPLLFGISPREAAAIEPQQRLALKLTWELFENAGLSRRHYAASMTGVFIGVCDNSYFANVQGKFSPQDEVYLPTGNAINVIAGRVNYCFNLSGPALVVDTACSSSLVAIDLAVQALRGGRCDMAIAGGINVMLDGKRNKTLTNIGMLSADGACRVFDREANGYVRSEAAGLVLLKRLSDAENDGDEILGVILSSACNHNATSAGLTVPSGNAQQRAMSQALADAGKYAGDIDWIEAHGTGTSLGDPIEFEAICNVFDSGAENRERSQPLYVTSLKSQFGHAEAAAGIVSLLKTLAVFKSRKLPPQFGLNEINPAIQAFDTPVEIPRKFVDFSGDKPLVAAINSFGFSGTNASMIVGSYVAPEQTAALNESVGVTTISGHTLPSLTKLSRAIQVFMENNPGASLSGIEYALNVGRTQLKHRKAFDSSTRSTLLHELNAFLGKESSVAKKHSMVFVFPGQGSQYPGMGKALYRSNDIFAEEFDTVVSHLSRRLERDLKKIIWDGDESHLNESTLLTQCSLFAVGYALGKMLIRLGVTPDYALGHSVGEVTACALAGMWEIDDACDIVVERGKLMERSPAGRMLSIRTSADEVASYIEASGLPVEIAAINDPKQTVISGTQQDVERFHDYISQQGLLSIELPVRFAFHSRFMTEAARDFGAYVASKPSAPSAIEIVSTLTGKTERSALSDPDYWIRQMLNPVDFVSAVLHLEQTGDRVFVEIGANATFTACIARTVRNKSAHRFVSWEKPGDQPGGNSFAVALGHLFENGANIDWSLLYRNRPGPSRVNPLPTYCFDEEKHLPQAGTGAFHSGDAASSPIHYSASPYSDTKIAEHMLSLKTHPYLYDHVVFGEYLAPGAMHCIYALDAVKGCYGKQDSYSLSNIHFTEAAVCKEGDNKVFQAVFQANGDKLEFTTVSFVKTSSGFDNVVTHSLGEISSTPNIPRLEQLAAGVTQGIAKTAKTFDAAQFYEQFAKMAQLNLGPSFTWCRKIEVDGKYAIADFSRDAKLKDSPFKIDPGLLDSCFQVIGAIPLVGMSEKKTFVPFSVRGVTVVDEIAGDCFTCYADVEEQSNTNGSMITGNAVLVDRHGKIVIKVDGLTVKKIDEQRLLRRSQHTELGNLLYNYAFEASDPVTGECSPDDLVRCALPEDQLDKVQNEHATLERIAFHIARAANAKLADCADLAPTIPWLRERLLEIEAGQTADDSQVDAICAGIGSSDPRQIFLALKAKFPDLRPELGLLELSCEKVAGVLTGEHSGVSVLFPEGDTAIVERLYRDSASAATINRQIANSLLACIAKRDNSAPIRILEIGGGTGGTTAYLLSALTGRHFKYHFTDISPAFVKKARERFQGDNFDFSVLDIEQDISAQGFSTAHYDIVIAANVLHATKNVKMAVHRANSLLKLGGKLLLLEGNGKQAWLDVTFGLTDGWWHFNDERLAAKYALLEAEQWRQLLEACGYSVAELAEQEQKLPQVVYIATKEIASGKKDEVCIILSGNPSEAAQFEKRLHNKGLSETAIFAVAPNDDSFAQKLTDVIGEATASGRQVSLVYLSALDRQPSLKEHNYGPFKKELPEILALVKAVKFAINRFGCSFTYISAAKDRSTGVPNASFECAALKTLSFETLSSAIRFIQSEEVAQCADEYLAASNDPCVVYSQSTRYVRKIRHAQANAPSSSEFRPASGKSYLITGGSSPLADSVIEWLINRGAKRIDLLARTAPDANAHNWRALAQENQVTVVGHACDVRDERAVLDCVGAIEKDGYAVDCVFHLAGVLDNRLIEDLDKDSLEKVVETKVLGAFNVLNALKSHDLRRFVAYSSAAALFGSPGQLNHALANALLEELVQSLTQNQIDATSIAWGPWDEIGAAARDEGFGKAKTWGINGFSAEFGRNITHQLLNAESGYFAPLDVDWQKFSDKTGPIFVVRELDFPKNKDAERDAGNLVQIEFLALPELLKLDKKERRAQVTVYLQRLIGASLNIHQDLIRSDDRVHDVGLDSLVAIELKSRLKAAYNIDISAKIFMDNLSIDELAAKICGLLIEESQKTVEHFVEGVL